MTGGDYGKQKRSQRLLFILYDNILVTPPPQSSTIRQQTSFYAILSLSNKNKNKSFNPKLTQSHHPLQDHEGQIQPFDKNEGQTYLFDDVSSAATGVVAMIWIWSARA